MIIHQDCRHFRSDVPCVYHKDEGVHCEGCAHHDPIDFRILIVKLDAMGDVLRTTSILPPLKQKYPHAHITWMTRASSVPLLMNNPFVDRIVDYSAESFLVLQVEQFDLVLGLDASPESARATSLAHATEKRGFGYDPRGHSFPLNEETRPWYEMGLFDDVKKRNSKTYQEILFAACGLRSDGGGIVYTVTEEERAAADVMRRRWRITDRKPLIGINPGSGGRWINKKWPERHVVTLIRKLSARNYRVLLLGGQDERDLNGRIKKKVGKSVIDAGCNHSVRDYAAIMELCDLLVTMDTLSLHLALALGKRVVALFGPTSAVEIEMYGRGVKLGPKRECECYYRRSCTAQEHCMETIDPAEVFATLEDELGK